MNFNELLKLRSTEISTASQSNSTLTNNFSVVSILSSCLFIIIMTVLFSFLPLLASAQLTPLVAFQDTVFADTPEETEQGKKKVAEKKMTVEMKKEKEYKERKSIQVKDPEGFYSNRKDRLFSGPQAGEKLPPYEVKGLDGEEFNIAAQTDGKPIVLFMQDANGVGIKGFVNAVRVLLRIDTIHKRQNGVNAEKANHGIQIGVVILADDIGELPDWAERMLKDEIPNVVLKGISQNGREGPGSYGLNRNVSQTVIVVKDGVVQHNFAFTQPMLYVDSHLLGALAQAIDVESTELEKWLNEESQKEKKSIEDVYDQIQKAVSEGRLSKSDAIEKLKRIGLSVKDGDELFKREKENKQEMARKRTSSSRQDVIKNPADFKKTQEAEVFSGPQPGEKLPPLPTNSIVGESAGELIDFSKTDVQPLILFLQDGDGAGIRGLDVISSMIEIISNNSKQPLLMNVVFLGDDADSLKKRVGGVASRIAENGYPNLQFGISPDGREGPGSYGLNRNVSQTILVTKEGEVLHNFAFTQPSVYANPYVLGAITQVIGEKPEQVAKWLNEDSADERQMLRGRQMQREAAHERQQTPSQEELVKRFDRDRDGKLNEEENMAARRALANRESQNRNRRNNVVVKDPNEFKKMREKVVFSGPQTNEKLPSLMATALNGASKNKTSDFITEANGQPLILILQDDTPLGLRGLVGFARLLDQIDTRTAQKLHIQVVFLGDTPDALTKHVSRIIPHVSSKVLLGISPDGREGPGSYGLNRSVAQTILIAKDGKVLYNFALTQPMLSPDPYVLGAVGELMGQTPATIENWLNKESGNSRKMVK